MNQVKTIISNLNEVTAYLKDREGELQKLAQSKAPRFNPFHFMRTDEMGLSQLMAFLLDPKAEHGQGRLFLDKFLEQIDCFEYLSYDSAIISVEKTLADSLRRHDILIKGQLRNRTVWVISIENKLRYAGDQKEQVKDYIEDIKDQCSENYLLLYLKPYLGTPTEYSISEDKWNEYEGKKHAKAIDGQTIYQWLDSCTAYADNIQLFIKQFKNYLKENIMGELNEEEKQALIEKIKGDRDLLATTIKLAKIQDDLRCQLLDDLVVQFRKLLEEEEQYSDWSVSGNPKNGWSKKYSGIFFQYKESDIYLGLENQDGNFDGWIIGIRLDETASGYQKIKSYYSDVNKSKSGKTSSKTWPFYTFLEEPYRDWGSRESVWFAIKEGKFANDIFNEFKNMVTELENNQLLEIEKGETNE